MRIPRTRPLASDDFASTVACTSPGSGWASATDDANGKKHGVEPAHGGVVGRGDVDPWDRAGS